MPTNKRVSTEKRPKQKNKKINSVKLDANDILLRNREVFIYENITPISAQRIIKELRALNSLEIKPIKLWINSCGGCVSSGFAIINTIKSIKSKVITIINAKACSMGAHIAVVGNERLIVSNGIWQSHDMRCGGYDYSLKIEDRALYFKKLYKLLEENLKKHTDLTTSELKKARAGEIWLLAEDALEKGIVDKIIEA